MAEQLDLPKIGQIIPTALHSEMERSYLEYAMSVIVGRALPDVRDGLKPVHRRILYAMHELGLTPDRPYRKCARVVGDVLGKYHPHGDQAVYEAMVRMIQPFSSRYPLLDGHGNFGSVDNDPPAAMRYTESRLAPLGFYGLLQEIGESTVEFTSNFDNSQQEPVVLPAQLPILLLNGCSGIAVGMATNIPPHNLGEIVDGLIALIDNPNLSDEALWQLIPGPDFPTGGKIVSLEGLQDAYRTGRGSITIRGIVHTEKIDVGVKRKRTKQVLVVTELPYQVNKAGWIEKVADLVNDGKIKGISDIRDESDRSGVRVVIELKREEDPAAILAKLYRKTALQSNFGIIMLALVNNKPCQLSLREVLEEFLQFRETTLTRQYNHEVEQARDRLHLVEGLLLALNEIDQVIDILRSAPDGTTAKYNLKERLDLSEGQGDAILAMPMRRLTGLEQGKLETEAQELRDRISQLELLLSDRHELFKSLKKELRQLKKKYNNPRLTRIEGAIEVAATVTKPQKSENSSAPVESTQTLREPGETPKAPKQKRAKEQHYENLSLPLDLDIPVSEDAEIIFNSDGYIGWEVPNNKGKLKSLPLLKTPYHGQSQLWAFTNHGKAYPVQLSDIPPAHRGQSLLSLLPKTAQRDADRVIACFAAPDNLDHIGDLVLLSRQGRIKKLAVEELANLTNRGLTVMKVKADDELMAVHLATPQADTAIATTSGRLLRFAYNQLPLMGGGAQGNQALRLRTKEELVGCVNVCPGQQVLLLSRQGYGAIVDLAQIRQHKLNDLGSFPFQFKERQDMLAGITAIATMAQPLHLLSAAGGIFSIELSQCSSAVTKLVELPEDDHITILQPAP